MPHADANKMYKRAMAALTKPPEQRSRFELLQAEEFFRAKSKILSAVPQETLLDVIQHCDFVTRNKDDVIILQGERGHRFFIVLRGLVAVMLKDSLEDADLGEEKLEPRTINRESLGNTVVQLGEGATFGELALIHPDCVRTASIVADEKTDLVVIHRDLYNRSVSKVIAREYDEKMQFIESVPILRDWPQKLKRQLAVSFRKEVHNFDSHLVKQGDPVTDLYFIVQGEVKLVVDPEAHYQQFSRFMKKCSPLIDDDDSESQSEASYVPLKLLPQLQKYTRMNKASLRNPSGGFTTGFSVPLAWSPSAIRKMNIEMHHRRVSINLCYLGERQMISDVELVLGLPLHHASAVCSCETVVMALHKNHFDRLFRKKCPSSIKLLSRNLETQLTMRCMKTNILETAPILRCMLYRIQDSNGERKPGDEKGFITTLRQLALEGGRSSPTPWDNSARVLSRRRTVHSAKRILSAGRPRTMIIPKIDL